MTQRTINITGEAKNISGHAALVAENISSYFIDGMNKWEDGWLGKKIKVIGDLKEDKENHVWIIAQPLLHLLQEEEKI